MPFIEQRGTQMTNATAIWTIQPALTGDTLCNIRAAVPGYSRSQKIAEVTDLGAQGKANANLIVAAPVMLATLHLIANADIKAVCNEVQARTALTDMMELARAAIAKAEGR